MVTQTSDTNLSEVIASIDYELKFTIREQVILAISDYYSVNKKLPESYSDISMMINIPDGDKLESAKRTFRKELERFKEVIPLMRENMYLQIGVIALLSFSTILSVIITVLLLQK